MRRRLLTVSAALLGLALLASCGGAPDRPGGDGSAGHANGPILSAVATTTHVADLVGEVGGDRVEVARILDAEADPHGFEPRFGDVTATANADVLFMSGAGLDPWAVDLASDSGSDAETVDLSEHVPYLLPSTVSDGEQPGHADRAGATEDHDPHWWHDPRNAAAAVVEIGRELARLDPAGAGEYGDRARGYAEAIEKLDSTLAACFNRLPADRRYLITDHESFDYLAERYGLTVVGAVIPALSTQAQASARDISQLVATIEELDVRAIFPSQSANPDVVDTVAEQTGADSSRNLYSDSLGPSGSGADTYTGMMAANADAIVRGLSDGRIGCEAP